MPPDNSCAGGAGFRQESHQERYCHPEDRSKLRSFAALESSAGMRQE
jgi:hypothetical protein